MDSADEQASPYAGGVGEASSRPAAEVAAFAGLCRVFAASPLPLALKLQNFTRHVRRQDLARFLAKYELFKQILPVNGSIAECGVFVGGGLLTWYHLSAILEPYNHTRKIIGFDTFAGFPGLAEQDRGANPSEHLHEGGFKTPENVRAELEELVALHDQLRPLAHLGKIELVAGDACQTIPAYVAQHPHLVLSLIHLDFDLYEPTKAALQALWPRLVKGGVVAFDELNCPRFPGETSALIDVLGLDQAGLRRFPFDPYPSYLVKG